MMKRLFDIIFSSLGIIFFSPILFLISIFIKWDSQGNILYLQERTGQFGKVFKIFKFRTMFPNSQSKGTLTIGNRDPRITKVGVFLRKYKLDELPQLFNVFFGEMSIVGPRPDLKKYTDLYTEEQRQILQVKPGITDYASITFRNEVELLSAVKDPEAYYVNEIIPKKIALNLKYIHERSYFKDIKIILKTLYVILFE